MPPPMAAASLRALEIMHDEPERVNRLRANGAAFRIACRSYGMDTGTSIGAAIVPVMVGQLHTRGPHCATFVCRRHQCSAHSLSRRSRTIPPAFASSSLRRMKTDQLEDVAKKTAAALALAESEKLDYAALARALG